MIYRLYLFNILMLLGTVGRTQVSYGEVRYTATTLMDDQEQLETEGMPDAISEALNKMMREGGFDQNYVLTFTPESYTFWEIPRGDKTIEDGGITVQIMGSRNPAAYHTDLRTGAYTAVRTVADRPFYIDDRAEVPDWQITGEEIPASDATLGFDLRVATAVLASGDSLHAAFAPALPIAFGPMNVYGLPGAILRMDVCHEGECKRYAATDLKIMGEAPKLPKPVGTKPVSQAEYNRQLAKYEAREKKSVQRRLRN